jgi:DNA-binding winged helix-turn-helix (wHTH) protein
VEPFTRESAGSAGDTSAGDTWSFGRFRLIPARQLLLRDGVPVRIGSRALDILTILVRRGGELIDKNELIAAVWPDTFVDESNLKVNVCSLRRSLGDTQKPPQYIATVAGRGYRFVAPVQVGPAQAGVVRVGIEAGFADLVPPRDIVGREREFADILAALRGKPHAIVVVGRGDGMVPSLVRPLT